MAKSTGHRRSTITEGVTALAKSLILLVGVPLALARLWLVSPLPAHLLSTSGISSLAAWSHAAIVFVGLVWGFASVSLLREITGALRNGEMPGSNWSTRWAIAIAALVVTATASPAFLPGSRVVNARPVAAAPARPASWTPRDHVRAVAGECLPELAERVSGCADDWPEIAALNFGALQPDGARMLDPARLRGGWRLRVSSHARRRPGSSTRAPSDGAARLSELALIGLGVVTVCALARRVRILRRRGNATRSGGEHLLPPPSRIASIGAAIEPYATAPILDWIDVANRLLSRSAEGGEDAFDVRLVRAGPEGVEFLLGQPRVDVPWPFRAEHDGRWWRLDAQVDLETLTESADGLPWRYPALVPVGDDECSSYLVPLQPGRRLGITGDPELVDAALRAIVTGLRVVPWAEHCAVELIGLDAPSAAEQCYQFQSGGHGALTAFADSAAPHARVPRTDVSPRQPVIVIARDALREVDEEVLERASKLAGVIIAGRDGSEVIHVDEQGAVLHPFAVALTGIIPSEDQTALVDSLLKAASRPAAIVPIPDRRILEGDLGSIPAIGVVECRVLRAQPDVIGLAQRPYRGDADRVVECLAYVALHGGRVDVDAIASALFARSAEGLRRDRTENTLSALRASLGETSTGRPLLFRQGDEVCISDEVSCDWLRAERAIAAAGRVEPGRAIELLRSALELAAGPPCDSVLAGFGWLRSETIAGRIEATLVDGAHRLCTLALAANDTALARWAVEVGAICVPESEILARDLMAVCDAEGDRGGVRSAFAELEAALERLGHNEPSAETRAFLEALEGD